MGTLSFALFLLKRLSWLFWSSKVNTTCQKSMAQQIKVYISLTKSSWVTEETNTLFLPLNALGGGDPRYFLKTVALSKVEWSLVYRNVFSLHEESTSCPKRKTVALKCLIASL